jgi:predicted CoA-binding protein
MRAARCGRPDWERRSVVGDESGPDEFFEGGRWAVVGVSRDPYKYGYIVHRRLKTRGEEVYAVNPNVDEVDGEPCYASLADLPEQVDQIVVVIPPGKTEEVVEAAADQGVTKVWMQPGAESTAAVDYCRERGLNVVSGRCILRYMDLLDAQSRER